MEFAAEEVRTASSGEEVELPIGGGKRVLGSGCITRSCPRLRWKALRFSFHLRSYTLCGQCVCVHGFRLCVMLFGGSLEQLRPYVKPQGARFTWTRL